MAVLRRFRNPRYTGSNRCYPCTVVNLVVAGLVAGALAVLAVPFGGVLAGVGTATFVFGSAAAVVWLRGYLLPGTPQLTRRYLPPGVLSPFGKEPVQPAAPGGPAGEFDVEAALLADGVAGEDDAGDLVLADGFASAWKASRDTSNEADDEEVLAAAFDSPADDVRIYRYESGGRLRVDRQQLLTWPSGAAKRADLMTATVLPEWVTGWNDLANDRRAALVLGVRVLLRECPDGDPAVLREGTVTSCCSSRDVLAVTCANSGHRLYEHPVR